MCVCVCPATPPRVLGEITKVRLSPWDLSNTYARARVCVCVPPSICVAYSAISHAGSEEKRAPLSHRHTHTNTRQDSSPDIRSSLTDLDPLVYLRTPPPSQTPLGDNRGRWFVEEYEMKKTCRKVVTIPASTDRIFSTVWRLCVLEGGADENRRIRSAPTLVSTSANWQ